MVTPLQDLIIYLEKYSNTLEAENNFVSQHHINMVLIEARAKIPLERSAIESAYDNGRANAYASSEHYYNRNYSQDCGCS